LENLNVYNIFTKNILTPFEPKVELAEIAENYVLLPNFAFPMCFFS